MQTSARRDRSADLPAALTWRISTAPWRRGWSSCFRSTSLNDLTPDVPALSARRRRSLSCRVSSFCPSSFSFLRPSLSSRSLSIARSVSGMRLPARGGSKAVVAAAAESPEPAAAAHTLPCTPTGCCGLRRSPVTRRRSRCCGTDDNCRESIFQRAV